MYWYLFGVIARCQSNLNMAIKKLYLILGYLQSSFWTEKMVDVGVSIFHIHVAGLLQK